MYLPYLQDELVQHAREQHNRSNEAEKLDRQTSKKNIAQRLSGLILFKYLPNIKVLMI